MSDSELLVLDALKAQGHWTREQTILAFELYCRTRFGRLHSRNKDIVALADALGRSAGAVAMKCVNLASLDPAIRARGLSGLSNASAMDRKIWDESHANWTQMLFEAEILKGVLDRHANYDPPPQDGLEPEYVDFTGYVREAWTQQRVNQRFFRKAVLNSYGTKCCISGVSDARFLVASHIAAWKDDAANRLNPANGLCLSSIHDRAFDRHLFSLTDEHRVILSDALKETKDVFLREVFWPIEDRSIDMPERFVPKLEFIASHRKIMLEAVHV